MFYQLLAITIKELRIIFRDKGVLSVLFILPIIFVVLMTYAGVGNQGIGQSNILVVNQDQGSIASSVIDRLREEKNLIVTDYHEGEKIHEDIGEKLLLKNNSRYSMILKFPPLFSESLLQGEKVLVEFIADPATGGSNLNPVERLIKIHVMNISGYLEGARIGQALIQAMDTPIPQNVQFSRSAPKGLKLTRPIRAEEQNVPGYTIFGIFFIVQVIGTTFLKEKEEGTYNRIMTVPISPSLLLFGKLVPFYFVNLLQVLFMFVFSYYVFDISMGKSFLGIFLVTIATAATANSLGLLIASISKTTEQMGPLSSLILISSATVGGIFIPYFEMPKFLQTISFLTPHAWALKGYQDILVREYHLIAVLPTCAILLAFSAIFYVMALSKIRLLNRNG